MTNSPFTTPKRKRSEMLNDDHALKINTSMQFTFDINSTADDGNASPRTRVAHRFRGLALGSGGGDVSRPLAEPSGIVDNDTDEGYRKRIKLRDTDMPDVGSLEVTDSNLIQQGRRGDSQTSQNPISIALDEAVVSQSETIAHTRADDSDVDDNNHDNNNNNNDNDNDYVLDDNSTSNPSLTQPSARPAITFRPQPRPRQHSKIHRSPARKRAGTPPFPSRSAFSASSSSSSSSASSSASSSSTSPTITDPVRAALTWHDDEITIYDPDDSDDDGTGINGIGFKPTPAIAYARAMRRRQQLAEYKKREEREARAKRSARRRGALADSLTSAGDLVASSGIGKKGKAERRKVRFLEKDVPELIGV
ncbi:hypothetical protein VTH82DRAFT_6210 [Thermothelomyces myriococcoides]